MFFITLKTSKLIDTILLGSGKSLARLDNFNNSMVLISVFLSEVFLLKSRNLLAFNSFSLCKGEKFGSASSKGWAESAPVGIGLTDLP